MPRAYRSYLNKTHTLVFSDKVSLMVASKSNCLPSSVLMARGTGQVPPKKCSYRTTEASATHLNNLLPLPNLLFAFTAVQCKDFVFDVNFEFHLEFGINCTGRQ
jgi:hypothetical protein